MRVSKTRSFFVLFGLGLSLIGIAQEKSNLQTFTPSALFGKGEFEVNAFNSVYSQQERRNDDGENVDLNGTESFFTSFVQFTTGVSDKSRINVGLDLYLSRVRYSSEKESALNVFANDANSYTKTVLSYVAPRIKVTPFKNIPRLSVQSALLIPIKESLESPRFIAHDRYTWWTQVFYDKTIREDFQIFLEASILYRFKNEEANHNYDFFRVPLSAFFSYFPTSNSTIFIFSQYAPKYETTNFNNEEEFGLTQSFTQAGIGAKYQITNRIGLEVSYSNFIASKNDGAGYVLNFGLRYIKR